MLTLCYQSPKYWNTIFDMLDCLWNNHTLNFLAYDGLFKKPAKALVSFNGIRECCFVRCTTSVVTIIFIFVLSYIPFEHILCSTNRHQRNRKILWSKIIILYLFPFIFQNLNTNLNINYNLSIIKVFLNNSRHDITCFKKFCTRTQLFWAFSNFLNRQLSVSKIYTK